MNGQIYKILIIDDSAEDRVTFRYELEKNRECRYEFLEAEMGDRGIEICRAEHPDCVLLDYNLPDGDGLSVMREINPDPLDPEFAVVLLTGSGNEVIAVNALQNGAQDYLVKGKISPEDLHLSIQKAVEIVRLRKDKLQALKDLRQSEERLRLAFEGANIGAFDWNIKTGEIQWSSETEQSAAMSAEAFDNSFEGFIKLIHPLDRKLLEKRIADALRDGEYECEFRMLKGDGTIRWVIGKGRVLFDDDGTPARLVGVDIDITKRKLAEEELRESQHFTQSIIDTAPSVLYIFDLKTRTTKYLSEPAAQILGYSSDEVKEAMPNFLEHKMHPDDAPAIEKYFQKISQSNNGNIYELEHRMRHKSGEWRWFRSRDRVFKRDENGKAQEILGIASDITERKAAEVELLASEEFSRTVLESSPDCVKIVDTEGRLQYMNANGLCLLEIEDFALFKNQFWWNLWDEETKPVVKAAVEKAVRGDFAEFEAFCPTAKGTPKWWDVIVSPIFGTDGKIERIISVSRDITERKLVAQEREQLLEREQILRREAEHANIAKDEFLAVLSHELRSPINAMLGWAVMLNNGSLNEEMQRRAVGVIERNIRLQNALIEDLLDVSRIISGKMRLEPERISFVPVVQNAIDTARPAADAKNIKLETEFDSAADEMDGDAHRLQQIIGNLLTNAIKFTPDNGTVSIRLECAGETARLTIKDSGIGIGAELLPHVFERFQQADGSTRRQFGGLGLGLTIVRHLTEMHDGRVFAASEGEGKGSTFTVELPLVKSCQAEESVPAAGNVEKHGASEAKILADVKLLIVDDDADALDLLRFVLEQKGAQAVCAGSVGKALTQLRDDKFDLLISDLGMAGTDGYELIRQIRASENKDIAALPAIALTGYVSAEDRERVLLAGFQKHLSKPLDIDKLFAVVRDLIEADVKKSV